MGISTSLNKEHSVQIQAQNLVFPQPESRVESNLDAPGALQHKNIKKNKNTEAKISTHKEDS